MPRSTTPAWNCDDHACPICTAPERDDMTLMRCAILTLLEHGRWMASDDIPLRDILSAGGKYLNGFGGGSVPTPAAKQWAWLEAELRLTVARAAGLDAVSTLDPRIDRVPGHRRPPHLTAPDRPARPCRRAVHRTPHTLPRRLNPPAPRPHPVTRRFPCTWPLLVHPAIGTCGKASQVAAGR